jgi:hypothetical protein
MRKIIVESWDELSPSGEANKVNTLKMIEILFSYVPDKDMPKGFRAFSLFSKIGDAMIKAESSSIIELEEEEYSMLRGMFEKYVPAAWAMNKHIAQAVNNFIDAKEE